VFCGLQRFLRNDVLCVPGFILFSFSLFFFFLKKKLQNSTFLNIFVDYGPCFEVKSDISTYIFINNILRHQYLLGDILNYVARSCGSITVWYSTYFRQN